MTVIIMKKKPLTEEQLQASREWQKRYYNEKIKPDAEAMERRRKIAYEWYLKQDHEAHCAKQRERQSERYYAAKEQL
jgi:hypothetical protein